MYKDSKGQKAVSYDEYLLYCEQLNEQPDPTKLPVRYDDLDYCAQRAWDLFPIARTQVIMSPTGVVGLSASAVLDLLNVYEISVVDRKLVLENIFFMFNYVEERISDSED